MGTWDRLGGYVLYAGDGPNSQLPWDLFDKVDLLLRKVLLFTPSQTNFSRCELEQ